MIYKIFNGMLTCTHWAWLWPSNPQSADKTLLLTQRFGDEVVNQTTWKHSRDWIIDRLLRLTLLPSCLPQIERTSPFFAREYTGSVHYCIHFIYFFQSYLNTFDLYWNCCYCGFCALCLLRYCMSSLCLLFWKRKKEKHHFLLFISLWHFFLCVLINWNWQWQ